MTTINEEVDFIGPGHKRIYGSNRRGYWAPELATWKDSNGFSNIMDLQAYSYLSGIKVTGVKVNASPIVCITKSNMGESDVLVEFTGSIGVPSGTITTGDVTITGYEEFYQYNQKMFRRLYVTGGDEFKYSFTIPAYTPLGTTFEIPTKRCYQVSGITATPQNANEPLTNLGFYALADNGSKLLYSMNWNKTFDNVKKNLYGMFGHPNKCPRCMGSGYYLTESDTCDQCNGYGFDGLNASGFLLDQIARDEGLIRGEDDDMTLANKIWAMKWHVTPTKKDIKRYFAHFARIDDADASIEVNKIDRPSGPTGIEGIVQVLLPYNLPLSVFSTTDGIWERMTASIEPAGVDIDFSFLVGGVMSGNLTWDEMSSIYMSGYVSAEYTGLIPTSQSFGFYQPQAGDYLFTNWYKAWGEDWFFFDYGPSGHVSGGISGVSGQALISGTTYTYISGLLQGSEWLRWAWPENTLVNDTVWSTGDITEILQQCLWDSGTFYHDNFWVSGGGSTGCIY